jgi:Epoxide hydrolase N terminus
LNALPEFVTTIDGVDIQFIHVRSREPNALPLILTHGWPGSPLEFLKVIGPLTDPVAYGGRAEDAFDVVIPAIPGYGFSGRPTDPPATSLKRRLTHLGRDQASIGFRPPVQQVSEPSEKGPALLQGCSRRAQPSFPSSLKADVCFRLVVLRIGSDELTSCGIMRLKRHTVLLIIKGSGGDKHAPYTMI